MAEKLYWIPENPDEEPYINLGVGDRSYELNRTNSTLHTYLGRLAVFNHVFYADIRDNEVKEAFYIFSESEGFETMEKFMREREFPSVLNQTSISSVDQDAYVRYTTKDMPDSVPEDW